jgi:hypothetical protein
VATLDNDAPAVFDESLKFISRTTDPTLDTHAPGPG